MSIQVEASLVYIVCSRKARANNEAVSQPLTKSPQVIFNRYCQLLTGTLCYAWNQLVAIHLKPPKTTLLSSRHGGGNLGVTQAGRVLLPTTEQEVISLNLELYLPTAREVTEIKWTVCALLTHTRARAQLLLLGALRKAVARTRPPQPRGVCSALRRAGRGPLIGPNQL